MRGFTLIELMIVIAILGILGSFIPFVWVSRGMILGVTASIEVVLFLVLIITLALRK